MKKLVKIEMSVQSAVLLFQELEVLQDQDLLRKWTRWLKEDLWRSIDDATDDQSQRIENLQDEVNELRTKKCDLEDRIRLMERSQREWADQERLKALGPCPPQLNPEDGSYFSPVPSPYEKWLVRSQGAGSTGGKIAAIKAIRSGAASA